MLAIFFVALGVGLAWLAVDAWRLRGEGRLPSSKFFSLLGQTPPNHLPLQEQARRQEYFEKTYLGKTDQMPLVFILASISCFLAAAYLVFGSP